MGEPITSGCPEKQIDSRQVRPDPLRLEQLPPCQNGVPEAGILVRYAAVQQMIEGVGCYRYAVPLHLVDKGEGRLEVSAAAKGLYHVVVRHLGQNKILLDKALSQPICVLQGLLRKGRIGARVE